MEEIEANNHLTIYEIMDRLKVCRHTVINYTKNKKLDFIKLRGKVFITEESYKTLFIPESQRIQKNNNSNS